MRPHLPSDYRLIYSLINSLAFSRKVSIDYVEQQSRTSSRQSSLDRNMLAVCPICVDVDIMPDFPIPDGATPTNFRQNVCAECNKTVCRDCGSFELDQQTKVRFYSCYIML